MFQITLYDHEARWLKKQCRIVESVCYKETVTLDEFLKIKDNLSDAMMLLTSFLQHFNEELNSEKEEPL